MACSSCTAGSARLSKSRLNFAVRYFHHLRRALNMARSLRQPNGRATRPERPSRRARREADDGAERDRRCAMRARRMSLVVLALSSVGLLGACSNDDSSTAASTDDAAHTITVHGVGKTDVAPDLLTIEVGAEATESTAAAAF